MGCIKKFHNDSGYIDFIAAAIGRLTDAISCFSFTNAYKALQKPAGGELIPTVSFPDLNMPVKQPAVF